MAGDCLEKRKIMFKTSPINVSLVADLRWFEKNLTASNIFHWDWVFLCSFYATFYATQYDVHKTPFCANVSDADWSKTSVNVSGVQHKNQTFVIIFIAILIFTLICLSSFLWMELYWLLSSPPWTHPPPPLKLRPSPGRRPPRGPRWQLIWWSRNFSRPARRLRPLWLRPRPSWRWRGHLSPARSSRAEPLGAPYRHLLPIQTKIMHKTFNITRNKTKTGAIFHISHYISMHFLVMCSMQRYIMHVLHHQTTFWPKTSMNSQRAQECLEAEACNSPDDLHKHWNS